MRLRNYSERTITTYVTELSSLAKHYQKSPADLSRDQVKDFCYYLLQEKHLSNTTINQLISAWKILQVDVLGNKWEGIKITRPRTEKKLPTVLSQEEAYRAVTSSYNVKHRTLLMLAYATGMRCEEVLCLKPEHIDSSRKVVRVKGKGNKEREVPLPENLTEQLRDYYKQYRPATYLFEGKMRGNKYTGSSFRRVAEVAGNTAGITKKITPHVLRHSFATHMLERGINLKRLQMLMGHSSLSTTSGYLHLAHPYMGEVPNLLEPLKITRS